MRFALPTLLAALICAACGSSRAVPRPLQIASSYLGLDCGNAFPCAHLGIAVWLKAPENRVTVTLHGRRVTLATHRGHEYGRAWIGFVRDPIAERLAEVDDMRRTVHLAIAAVGRDGTVRRATLSSPVSPGWG